MPVLERSELQASPLADLHAIANEVGLDGFRRLRKEQLIDAILGEAGPAGDADVAEQDDERTEEALRARRRRPARARRSR
ncbi:MAG: Rho termination factor N-terminal domain-containing protein, partial [Solirubrobacteraceae bacterium]